MSRSVEGFSKWTKEEKIAWVAKNYEMKDYMEQ